MPVREATIAELNAFDPVAYWSTRERKVWTVRLEAGSRRKPEKATVYVTAATREGAFRTARANCHLKGNVRGHAYLATPRDLGATWIVEP